MYCEDNIRRNIGGWRRVLAIGISGSELLRKPGSHMGSHISEEEQYWFPIQFFLNFPLHALFVSCCNI